MRILLGDERTGKERVLKFGQDSISHLLPPNFPKFQCYANFAFCAITGKTGNRINNYVQIHRQNRPELV